MARSKSRLSLVLSCFFLTINPKYKNLRIHSFQSAVLNDGILVYVVGSGKTSLIHHSFEKILQHLSLLFTAEVWPGDEMFPNSLLAACALSYSETCQAMLDIEVLSV